MTPEDIQDQYGLFVLGIADAEAAEEIRVLLAQADPKTVTGVTEARALMATMALTAPDVPPPARLRAKILAMVRPPEAQRSWWPGWLVATAMALALVYVGTRVTSQRERIDALQTQLSERDSQIQNAKQILDFLDAPDMKHVDFGKGANGRVLVSPGQGVLLVVSDLPPAPAGRIYQMWLVPKAGAPRSAGLFQTLTGGKGIRFQPGSFDLSQTAAVAVSLEPASGSPAPTTTPLIVAPL